MSADEGPPERVVDYGIDAPGVIRGMLTAGAAGLVGGGTLAMLARRPLGTAAGALIATGAAVPLGLGLAMIGYGRRGKYRLREWMLARHEWRGDERVLDVGAGRGLLAVGAAKRLDTGRVTALDLWRTEDLSDNGPEQLQANAEREGVADRIEIVTGDARHMDIPDASIDVVLSVLCLHNIEPAADREQACREIVRVLRPGGRVLIADYRGTADYARQLEAAGCAILGHHNLVGLCRSLMWVVEAVRPAGLPASPMGR